MYPNQSLTFPEEFAFYTVRKQELNKNKEFVYVAGVMDAAGQLSDMHIAMKKVVDTANNTAYTRMSPASVFEVTNPSEDARTIEVFIILLPLSSTGRPFNSNSKQTLTGYFISSTISLSVFHLFVSNIL